MASSGLFTYSPYGYCPGSLSPLGFNGERLDSVSGSYLLGIGYRLFIPALMRFSSPDDVSPFGAGDLNCYGYCIQDPINYRDPSGNSRIGRFLSNSRSTISSIFGQPKPSKAGANIFHSIHANVTSVAVAPVQAFGPKNGLGKVFQAVRDISEIKLQVTMGRSDTAGYDLIGFHGSTEFHKASLEAGLVINPNDDSAMGPGFHYSPDIAAAKWYARYAEYRDQGVGYVYGVYAKNDQLRRGVDLDYDDGDGFRVIRESGFDKVLVRDFIQYPLVRRGSDKRRGRWERE
ncbi:RHS repeat-associated core domain-containing protein [Pseudomonas sp. KCJK9111]|uniref:RHS repeat-associated core domain-containing protein n=1 Tax=Pseudomonas sp. KCJK9111 TaxID=3344555 RepID=UPI00390635A2